MADCVLVEKTEGVTILTLNRPEQLNAMNHQLNAELHDAVTRACADDDVACIVITGAGNRAFSAGGDIHEQRENDRKYTQAELDALTDTRMKGSYEISACAKPTIGMINGLAYGGAGVLASSLDMRVGCEHASFRFLAAAYGRINSTWTLQTRSAGPSPRSCCSPRASWRPKRPTGSACSITSCPAPSCAPRPCGWPA